MAILSTAQELSFWKITFGFDLSLILNLLFQSLLQGLWVPINSILPNQGKGLCLVLGLMLTEDAFNLKKASLNCGEGSNINKSC